MKTEQAIRKKVDRAEVANQRADVKPLSFARYREIVYVCIGVDTSQEQDERAAYRMLVNGGYVREDNSNE